MEGLIHGGTNFWNFMVYSVLEFTHIEKTTRVNLPRTYVTKEKRKKRRVSKTRRLLIKSWRLKIFAENRSSPAKMRELESLNQTKHYDK